MHTLWSTKYFCLFSYLCTHPTLWLSTSGGEFTKKMADHHGNGLCRSATAVMYVVTLLTLW